MCIKQRTRKTEISYGFMFVLADMTAIAVQLQATDASHPWMEVKPTLKPAAAAEVNLERDSVYLIRSDSSARPSSRD